MLGAPANLEHLLGVVVEGVQGLAQIPQIMQRYLKVAAPPQSSAVPSQSQHEEDASLHFNCCHFH